MKIAESYHGIAFTIYTVKKSDLWCATAEIDLEGKGRMLTLNMPLENIGVAYQLEQRAIAAVRGAVHFTIDSFQRGAGVPKELPLGGSDGIVLRRQHLVPPEVDELIANEQYNEAAVKAMSAAARAQLAVEARVLFDEATAGYQTAVENARAAGEPSSPYENPSIRLAQIRARVAEGNLRICGVDPYYTPSPPEIQTKPDREIDEYAVPYWVEVYEAEAKVRAAQVAHETAKRNKSKDTYELSIDVHLAQQSLRAVETSAMLWCEGMSDLELEQIRKAALERFKSGLV